MPNCWQAIIIFVLSWCTNLAPIKLRHKTHLLSNCFFFSKDQIKNRLRKATIKFDLVAYCRYCRICPVLLIAHMKLWRMCCNSLLHCTQSKKKTFVVCLLVDSEWLFFLRLIISIECSSESPSKLRKNKNKVCVVLMPITSTQEQA